MKKSKKYLLKINSLKSGWRDRDYVLLHASFQILVDFMEGEEPGKIIDWSYDKPHRHAWREMRLLYSWWKNKRQARRDPFNDKRSLHPPRQFEKIAGVAAVRLIEPDKKKYAAYYRALKRGARLEEKWFEEDQKNLHRLINVRIFLWT